MLGAVIGDILGSAYEFRNIEVKDLKIFPQSKFTDDTVLTVATANAVLNKTSYLEEIIKFARRYPDAGYGGYFGKWIFSSEHKPYGSFGNGSAMRVSPVGWAFESLEKTLEEARKSAEITHNHPEGIKGAKAIAGVIFLARNGADKNEIRNFIQEKIGYSLKENKLLKKHKHETSCQSTVPQAITAFLNSTDFESALINAISPGGDTDTLAAMAGSMAHAYYKKLPGTLVKQSYDLLTDDLKKIIEDFCIGFNVPF